MLLFFVAVVRENDLKLLILTCVHSLVVPIDGLQFLHQRYDRPVQIPGFIRELLNGLVVSDACHAAPPFNVIEKYAMRYTMRALDRRNICIPLSTQRCYA